jgi:hypothetical protein
MPRFRATALPLRARVAGLNRIAIFDIAADGSLTLVSPLNGTANGLAGLAAY